MRPFMMRESPHHYQGAWGVSFRRTIPGWHGRRCQQNCFDVLAGRNRSDPLKSQHICGFASNQYFPAPQFVAGGLPPVGEDELKFQAISLAHEDVSSFGRTS